LWKLKASKRISRTCAELGAPPAPSCPAAAASDTTEERAWGGARSAADLIAVCARVSAQRRMARQSCWRYADVNCAPPNANRASEPSGTDQSGRSDALGG
jgi:hypothetical protein